MGAMKQFLVEVMEVLERFGYFKDNHIGLDEQYVVGKRVATACLRVISEDRDSGMDNPKLSLESLVKDAIG